MKKNALGRLLVSGVFFFVLGVWGPPLAAQSPPRGEMEIFSWWTGDAGTALEVLIKRFEAKHPQVKVVNTAVAGESGSKAKTQLKTRMLEGTPPDSVQVPAGREIIATLVKAERLEDLTALYQSQGWMAVFRRDLIRLLVTDDGIWTVPVDIQRANLMWYVPANLKKWGVTPPGTWRAFFQVAPKLKAQGVVPLALANSRAAGHLWESLALAVLGPDKWEALWNGALPWTSDEVIDIWRIFGGILEYTNADAANLTWQQAADRMVNGQAAFYIMGDWTANYLVAAFELKPGQDFGWSAAPETNGEFMFLADSFGLPRGAANREAALAWLAFVGSREGSDAFNPLKGAISAHLDSDLSRYGAYSRTAARDFARDRIVGSMIHGVVASEDFMNGFAGVMEKFLQNRNPQQAALAVEAIAMQDGIAP
jgi:glucose/mannose transport system substrate-binding protein